MNSSELMKRIENLSGAGRMANLAQESIARMNDTFRSVHEESERLMKWQSQQAAEKHQREVDAAENIRHLAEDSRLARESAAASDKKSKIAIWIAVLSMLMTIVAICVAHRDSEQTTKAIVDSIHSLKGTSK